MWFPLYRLECSSVQKLIIKINVFLFANFIVVMMDASLASATLRISSDDTWQNMETVANLNANDTNTSRVEAVRTDKLPIFPDPSRGNRYLMDFMANRSLFVSDHIDTQREISRMQLVWNGKSNYRKVGIVWLDYTNTSFELI